MDRAGNSFPISRRRLLLAGAVLAAGGVLPNSGAGVARAQTAAAGQAGLKVVSDGALSLPVGFAYPDAPREELEGLLSQGGPPVEVLRPDCNVTFVENGDRLIVFDVGSGPHFMPTAGKLSENLATAGIDPAAVTDVIFTHAHPDHLWGLTDDFDEFVFANATHHIGEKEWNFWSSPQADALPEDRQAFVAGARSRFAALEAKVRFVKGGDEVLPGIEAVGTEGHTPGHLSFMVHGSEPVLVAGDALTHSIVSFAHPEWRSGTDHDSDAAVRTRQALLDRLAADRARVIGFHFPYPGGGTVERRDNAFVFVPG